MQQLSAMDAAFVHGETLALPMHFSSVAIYDQSSAPGGKVRFKDILEVFQDAMHQVPLFRRRLVEVPLTLDQPYWIEDPHFDIEFHVRHVALPAPGDWRQFYIQLARLHSRPIDRSRPLWEAIVIEGLNNLEGIPEGSFAIMTKIHHAAMDGAAAAQLFTSIHEFGLEPRQRPNTSQPFLVEEAPSKADLLLRSYGNGLKRAGRLVNGLRSAARGYGAARKAVKRGELQAPPVVPESRFNQTPSAHRVITSLQLSLAEVQAARKKVDGLTLNEFMLAVFGGAMRQYLEAKGELPEEGMVAQAPVNLRSKRSTGDDGNQITTINIALRSDIADPLERLRAVQAASHNAKEYARTLGTELLPELSRGIPPLLVKGLLAVQHGEKTPRLKALMPKPANTIISNVAGSPIPFYLCGARAVSGMALGPIMPGVGLFQSVISHDDWLIVSAVCCRTIMPDPEFYQQCLRDSYAAVLAACQKA